MLPKGHAEILQKCRNTFFTQTAFFHNLKLLDPQTENIMHIIKGAIVGYLTLLH